MGVDNLTGEQYANLDKLIFHFQEKIPAHILLKRLNEKGKNIFLNGILTEQLSDTLFEIEERVLGKIRISIFEIKDDGVWEDSKWVKKLILLNQSMMSLEKI